MSMGSALLREIERELARREWALTLGAIAVLATLLALGTSEDHDLFLNVVFVFFPLAWAPIAARAVVRDRESRMVLILAPSPLSRSAWWGGKVVAISLLAVISAAVTSLIATVMLSGAGPQALQANFDYVIWGLTLGACAVAVGALIGVLAVDKAPAAISLAFLCVILWVVAAEEAATILALASHFNAEALTGTILHLSPVVWAYDALQPISHPFIAQDSFPPVVPAVGLAAAFGAIGFICWTLLQEYDRWGALNRRRVLALAAAVGVCVIAVSVSFTWPFSIRPTGSSDIVASRYADFTVDYQGLALSGGGFRPWSSGDLVVVNFNILAPPGASFDVSAIRVTAPSIRFDPVGPDGVHVTVPEDRPASFSATYRVTVGYYGGHIPIRAHAMVNGESFDFAAWEIARPSPASSSSVALAGIVSATATSTTILAASRRHGDWT